MKWIGDQENLSTEHEFLGEKRSYNIRIEKGRKEREYTIDLGIRKHRVNLLSELSDTHYIHLLIDNVSYVTEIVESTRDHVSVMVDNNMFDLSKKVTYSTRVSSLVSNSSSKNKNIYKGIIKSKIPGKIVSIQVKPGDQIRSGDILVIMESMKMETTIKSSVDGVLKEVRVKVGDTVSPGDPIIIIKS